MNPVAWDAVIILTPQVTRLIGITEEITDKLLEVRVDMEPIFRIVINEDNSRQKEQFMRISDMLYYQKQRRSIGNWVFLVWWGIVVISSILMPGELGAILLLMVAVWFLALSAPQGIAEHRFDYWKDFPEIEKDGAGSQPDRFF